MVNLILRKIFGTKTERELKRLLPLVEQINGLEASISTLSDEQLQGKTEEFRARLRSGETLDDILPEAFSVVREASRRILNMRHFDVQLMGGMVLHEGKIAEMKTGEGKTLVATAPVYLNSIEGRGVHVVTVNDYLAKRDAQWMSPVYHFLGLTVGVIQSDHSFFYDPSYTGDDVRLQNLRPCSRHEAYSKDITYGTNNEFGFDYLRDNMKYEFSDYSQKVHNFAIVDEVDSILIDEARTPLIISGPSEESTDKYYNINRMIPKLQVDQDFTIDEKAKTAILTEEGSVRAEQLLNVDNLFDPSNIDLVHHVLQGLKAHHLFRKDVDYVVKNGEIIIVDEFTGRLMPGRRWSDGLHQAIEAKEHVKIASENQTLATITFQNYFRMYDKLAGMTGTADTEAEEFAKIYDLDVVVIPTNRDMVRNDHSDMIYKTEAAKFRAAINEIRDCHERGQPTLVGTISIEKSELLSKMLKKEKIPHSVLNAKYHEKEAEIIAQAGRLGAVTIATNMAGRGTDIVLGGNPGIVSREILRDINDPSDEQLQDAHSKAEEQCLAEKEKVLEAGGLHILGTERHEARRIDNQLRGRSGRQGDPGSSRFYLSLEDDLMRIFGSDRISGLMDRLGMEEDVPIENRLVSRAIETSQKRVESHNFDIRKHLLEYDDVMNKQRTEIYAYRREILTSDSLRDKVVEMIDICIDELLFIYCPEDKHPEEWNFSGLKEAYYGIFGFTPSGTEDIKGIEALRQELTEQSLTFYSVKESEITEEVIRSIEKMVMLQVVDSQWKDHLLAMDHLKEGIGLRGYGQRDPLVEYKREAYDMFTDMTDRINTEIITRVFRVQIRSEQELSGSINRSQKMVYSRGESESKQPVKKTAKVGRNQPCPCGSGKKYKKCCGANV
ncbi:MAG: preprotein translocase subunit SecA [Nitrospirota bacterium]|nr:MAG: preprotein translocase subunit SecA [Nitrospirota bacterium]